MASAIPCTLLVWNIYLVTGIIYSIKPLLSLILDSSMTVPREIEPPFMFTVHGEDAIPIAHMTLFLNNLFA